MDISDRMFELYELILPLMKKDGFDDTSRNRHAYLIGVRAASINMKETNKTDKYDSMIEALTTEICRLGDELPI